MEAVAGIHLDGGLGTFLTNIGGPAWQRGPRPPRSARCWDRLAADLADGALGIGVLVGYAPGADPGEYLQVAELAAAAGVPTFTHARDLIEMVPGVTIDGARGDRPGGRRDRRADALLPRQQHVAAARRPGARPGRPGAGGRRAGLHRGIPVRLGHDRYRCRVPRARAARRARPHPSSLTYAPTGEQVASVERLRELRATDPGGLVIIRLLDEDDPADRQLLLRPLAFPGAIVASDAMPLTWSGAAPDPMSWPLRADGVTHPRTAGTFSRALRLLAAAARSA